MRMLLAIVALGVAAELAAETALPEKYQAVVSRHPFGEPPPGFDPKKAYVDGLSNAKEDKEISAMQEEIVKNVSFSVINQESDGTVMVGFSDNTDSKQPHHYYIRVGETKNGWTVKEADTVAKTMTLVKDGIEVELSLGDKSGSAKTAATAQQKGGSAAEPSRGRVAAEGAPAPMSGFSHSRLARHRREVEKMKADMEAAKRKEEADRKAREEERLAREEERNEQRMQLEAIREELRRNREEKAAAATAPAAAPEEKPDEEN